MGHALAKTKPKTPPRARVLPRKPPEKTPAIAAAKTPKITAANPNGRTQFAMDCGKLVNAVFRFTDKHELPPSLRRRLRNCASDLWDLEWEDDAKSGALERSAFGAMARRAVQNHKEGKTMSLDEALARMKAHLR